MSEPRAKKILLLARRYYGQPYDRFFHFNNGRTYCSELPFLVYQQAGLPIGKLQTISELNVNNPIIEQFMRSRWKSDPICSNFQSFEACKPKLLMQKLVTPMSILKDKNMIVIFSNYPPIITSLATIIQR